MLARRLKFGWLSVRSFASTLVESHSTAAAEAPTSSADVQNTHSTTNSSSSTMQRSLWRKPNTPFTKTPQAWVSSLENVDDERLGIVDLHPDVFRVSPRLDILHRNITWQLVYRNLQMTKMLSKAEMPGGGRKPWPQKKTGRAHVGSIRAPHFIRGGFAHGVRGPRTWFYMLPDSIRLQGLCVALTVKLAQNDLHVVDRLDGLANGDPQFWIELCDKRNYGYSVLMVNETDEISGGLAEASETLPWLNVMPVYGLNCYSLLKYDTVILSRKALDVLEERLLQHLQCAGPINKKYRYADYKERILNEGKAEEDPSMPPFV